jgi:hypothetical protein
VGGAVVGGDVGGRGGEGGGGEGDVGGGSGCEGRRGEGGRRRGMRRPLLLLFNTTRAQPPDPQAREPLSLWTEVWPTQPVLTQHPY